jgi:RHS repeat-associated protein
VAPKRAEFKYKPDGQYDEIKRFNATTGGTAFVTSSYGYDNAGRLTLLDHKNSALTSITGYAMAYDAANRITSVDFTNTAYAAEDVVYSYDRTDQLTKADRSVLDENYEYDENGNRVMTGWVTGLNNQLLEDPTFAYTYDEEGNRKTKIRKNSSQIVDDYRVDYTWDHRNRLTKVEFRRNANSQGQPTTNFADMVVTKAIDYVYDAFDRLTRRTMDPDGATGSAALVSNEYLWDGEQLLYMDWIGIAGESRYYMYGPGGEVLFEEVAGNSVLYAVLTDHLGTYRDLVNTSGTTVNHVVYDAYGKIVSETQAAPNSPRVRFTGQLFDYQAGLNYHHHRWYDPAAGRWISEDPIGFEGDASNLARYANNSPIFAIDPTGLDTYVVNRTLGPSSPSDSKPCGIKNPFTHTFVYTTNAKGNLAHTYSWGNTFDDKGRGVWHKDRAEDVSAAREAIRQRRLYENDPWWAQVLSWNDWGVLVYDGQEFNKYVEDAFQILKRLHSVDDDVDAASGHGWFPFASCKHEARNLILAAKHLQRKEARESGSN